MGGCRPLAGQSVRRGACWAELAQLAIERGGVALQDHLRDVPDRGALVHKPATQRNLLGVNFGGRPKRTPRVRAATRPELVRWWMRARSNSAMPAKTVS